MIPSGEYIGHVLGWAKPFNLIWSGKYFYDNQVKNKIFGRWLIEGETYQYGDRVIIQYRFGLTDELVRTKDGWLGTMRLLGTTVRFTLVKKAIGEK